MAEVAIQREEVPYIEEVLSPIDQQNEYVMTSLRTMWGLDIKHIKDEYREDIQKEIQKKKIYQSKQVIFISKTQK